MEGHQTWRKGISIAGNQLAIFALTSLSWVSSSSCVYLRHEIRVGGFCLFVFFVAESHYVALSGLKPISALQVQSKTYTTMLRVVCKSLFQL